MPKEETIEITAVQIRVEGDKEYIVVPFMNYNNKAENVAEAVKFSKTITPRTGEESITFTGIDTHGNPTIDIVNEMDIVRVSIRTIAIYQEVGDDVLDDGLLAHIESKRGKGSAR